MVSLHPQERLLQEARALQASPAFKEYQRLRQASEHRLARMVQLGVRQARYFGRTKTLFQALMAATVANLALIAGKTGEMGIEGGAKVVLHLLFSSPGRSISSILDHTVDRISSLVGISPSLHRSRPSFRLSF